MTDRDPHTLNVIKEVSRTADRLAQRMGGQYVLNGDVRRAIDENQSVQRAAAR